MLARFGRHVRQQFVGYIALFIALGGVSYAVVTLPRNSVGSKQIKRAAVKNADIRNNAVTTAKVKDGSLLATDFALGQLPAGPQGAPGPQGPKGDTGDQGVAGTAVAYAHVMGDGTLDAPNSKNITSVTKLPGTGQYCVTTSVPVHLAVAGASSTSTTTIVRAHANIGAVHPTCTNAQTYVEVRTNTNTLTDDQFFIVWV